MSALSCKRLRPSLARTGAAIRIEIGGATGDHPQNSVVAAAARLETAAMPGRGGGDCRIEVAQRPPRVVVEMETGTVTAMVATGAGTETATVAAEGVGVVLVGAGVRAVEWWNNHAVTSPGVRVVDTAGLGKSRTELAENATGRRITAVEVGALQIGAVANVGVAGHEVAAVAAAAAPTLISAVCALAANAHAQ